MRELLVIVDMQNDFVTGALANPAAEKIVNGIRELALNFEDDIAFTLDSHPGNGLYFKTQEGKNLPVEHCVVGTEGWEVVPALADIEDEVQNDFPKTTFGSVDLGIYCKQQKFDRIYFVGTCTDICVISNVMTVKAFCPETEIVVFEDLCAGTTPENHQKAIDVMKICQVNVMTYEEKR